MEYRRLSLLSIRSVVLGLLLCGPVAIGVGVSQGERAIAQAIPAEAPFTDNELEPYEEEIEESLPPARPEEPDLDFDLWSEDEYDFYPSDDFVEIEGYEADIYDEQPGPADGDYGVYDEGDEGLVNNDDPFDLDENDPFDLQENDPFELDDGEDSLDTYEDNDLYNDGDDLYDTYEGL